MSHFAKQESFTADKDLDISPGELAKVRAAFDSFDTDASGHISTSELGDMLKKCDMAVSAADLPKVMRDLDIDGSGQVNFDEFVTYYVGMKTGVTGEGVAGKVMKKTTGFLKVEGAGGASHMFSEEEKIAFSEHINSCLADNADVARHMPLNTDNYDLFDKTGDGLIFCALINLAVPDTIDVRALNRKPKLNIYHKTENLNLALNAARGIGCQVVNIGAQDLIEGRPILILGLLWQIIRMQLLSQISIKNYPELVLLLDEGEELASLLKLTPEDILLRWFNYHLKRGGSSRTVRSWNRDLIDSECYSVLLNQLNPQQCSLVTGSDLLDRAQQVCNNTRHLGVVSFLHPADIVSGNRNLNVGFVAQLFNTCPGLTLTEEVMDNFDFASVMVDDVGDSREERVFRMWINSLNLPDVYINNLFEELQDGYIILLLEDTVQPGVVSWKRVNKGEKAKSRFKKVENCNYAVDIAKEIGLSVVNIGGLDLVDKKTKLMLALIWQLMRRHTINVLQGLASHQGIAEMTDEIIIQWANEKVKSSGKSSKMSSFRDPSLKSGVFLLELVGAIEPRAVNPELVTRGDNPSERLENAKYAISLARKVGACVFLTPEDIVEVKSKMIMTFVSSLWATDLTYKSA
jgi:plastin-1